MATVIKKEILKEMLNTEKLAEKLKTHKLKVGKNIIQIKDESGKKVKLKVVTYTGDESKVQKDMQDETDISNILEKYGRTGMLPVMENPGMYDDFSDIPDYQEAQNRIRRADEAFNALPSKLREKFENDPAKMIQFLSDKENTKEAIKLGLKKEVFETKPVVETEVISNEGAAITS